MAAIEPDFLAEHGYSTVPGELDFLRKLLLLTSEGSDLGFGPKCLAFFKYVGLSEIETIVHSPVTMGGGSRFPSAHQEHSAKQLVDIFKGWREELEPRLGEAQYSSIVKEADDLDRVRGQQFMSGEYVSVSSFPIWIVRGRKAME